MILINSEEYRLQNNEWNHTSTRVISTCVNYHDAQYKLKQLNLLNKDTTTTKNIYKLQELK